MGVDRTSESRPGEKRLLLVRHGLPDYSGGKPVDELPGPPLSALGRRQLAQTADFLGQHCRDQRVRPVRVYTSPLARARQSAEVLAASLGIRVRIDSDLKEWHRTEGLYPVTLRCARWLFRWMERDEPCAVLVSHGSPLLAILRTALYLPHRGWHTLSTADRFEFAMGSAFELVVTPAQVRARRLFHPSPRIMHVRNGEIVARPPRPCRPYECCEVVRSNFGRIIGCRNM